MRLLFLLFLLFFSTELSCTLNAQTASTSNYCEDLPKRWTELRTVAPDIKQDIRYATINNFTKKVIYDCPNCFLRPEAAQALIRVQKRLQKEGYGLIVFDCYRPKQYQQRLWDIVPDQRFVTPPSKGSMHSRGLAVDLSMVDKNGKEVNMGTPYDFFGKEAYSDYKELPKEVLRLRKLLRSAMEAEGFKSIKTEWWHYSYSSNSYELSDRLWHCEKK